jgi:hypothetical protein
MSVSPLDEPRPPESVQVYYDGREWVIFDVLGTAATADGGGP